MATSEDSMKVLVLGMCRTGTQSIAHALEELGYKPIYHMRDVGQRQHQSQWIAALEAKFEGKGREFGREEFLSFLSDYAGVSDIPAAIFAEGLIALFPNARVILTTRDEDKWYDSMMATIWHAWSAPNAKPSPMRALSDKYHQHLWASDFPKYGRTRFREHNALVQKIVPTERLLVYEVKEGWEPLCNFLQKEVPATPFPRQDDWLAYKKAHNTGSTSLAA